MSKAEENDAQIIGLIMIVWNGRQGFPQYGRVSLQTFGVWFC